MRQITPISKKNRCRQILILSVCILTLISCHEFDSLPNRIQANHSFAIPITDTTVSIREFTTVEYDSGFLGRLPEKLSIEMGEQRHGLSIDDYSPSQGIEWIEPKLIITAKNFPSGTNVGIKIYTKNANKEKQYFWLPEDYSISLVNEEITVPESPENKRIVDIEQLRQSRDIYLNIIITFPAAKSGKDIANYEVNVKFSIKLAIKTELKLNL